jgi:hypothetical protein
LVIVDHPQFWVQAQFAPVYQTLHTVLQDGSDTVHADQFQQEPEHHTVQVSVWLTVHVVFVDNAPIVYDNGVYGESAEQVIFAQELPFRY